MHPAVIPNVSTRSPRIWPVGVVALLSWLSIVASLDPAGSYPGMPEGPGLTIDEVFNVEQGVYLVEQGRGLGWLNLIPGTSQEAYRREHGYNPDHPPLGRWWLGVHHHVTWGLFPPFNPEGYCVTACARTGSATAFALTVLLVGGFATRWSGTAAGVMTAISLVCMPRLFGHAHVASLETMTNLTCTAAVLAVAGWWTGGAAPCRRRALLAGVFLGLALVTKIQAVLIPIPVICWACWRWRFQAVVPLMIWGVTGLVVFYLSWPYLWFAPLEHGLEYLGRATQRATIQVWYFGQKYADKEVPWHYPFVMFGLTVPLILHGLGMLGLLRREQQNVSVSSMPAANLIHGGATGSQAAPRENSSSRSDNLDPSAGSRDLLLLACTLFPLVVFAMPGVAVYDGERLFLTSFPLWSIFVGRGWVVLWQWLHQRIGVRPLCIGICGTLLACSAWPLVAMSPCYLSYYNELTPWIAELAGEEPELEIDYWGEGITRSLLKQLVDEVPRGATVAVMPTLHQFQADEYRRQSPLLRAHDIKMEEYQPDSVGQSSVLIYQRRADLPQGWRTIRPEQIRGRTIRQGRMLAGILNRDP